MTNQERYEAAKNIYPGTPIASLMKEKDVLLDAINLMLDFANRVKGTKHFGGHADEQFTSIVSSMENAQFLVKSGYFVN